MGEQQTINAQSGVAAERVPEIFPERVDPHAPGTGEA